MKLYKSLLKNLQVSVIVKDDDETEQQPKQPVYTIQAACEALQVLINFIKTRDNLNTSHLRALERLEGDLELLLLSSQRQRTLDRWFT
jgi:hypothetical protein